MSADRTGTAAAAATTPPAARWPLTHHAGQLVPREQAVLPVASIAMRYGVSVFEGIRGYRHADGVVRPWLLEPHLDRLRSSCRIMGLDPGCADVVPAVIENLLDANRVGEDCYLRVAVSAGNVGGIDAPAESVLTVSVTPAGRRRWLAANQGMRVEVSSWQRPMPAVFPSAAKNVSAYAGPRLALAQARRGGYDMCVLLTADGLVSEGPTATVWLVEDGRMVTPRLCDAVLPGVTRAWLMATAEQLGIEAAAEAITPQRLKAADEVFLCGTGIEFGPVREVHGQAPAAWPGWPVGQRLVEAYFSQARGELPVPPVRWRADDVPETAGAAGP